MNMDTFGGLDSAFLSLETRTSHLHVGAVMVLDPPEGRRSLFSSTTRFAQIRRLVEQRLHQVPRLRQRPVNVPFGINHPVWVDDPDFDVDDHLRRMSLPAPGGREELDQVVAEVMERPLELDQPLWEMVVVEDVAGGRCALIAKLHHAVLDGVSGANLLAAFFDPGPRGRPAGFASERWDPAPLPSSTTMLRHGVTSLVRQPERVVDAIHQTASAVVGVAAQYRQLADRGAPPPPAPFSAPRTSLNGSISTRRRYVTTSAAVEGIKATARVYATRANDVLLASVAGALRSLLIERGEDPDDPLVALVPVSTRRRRDRAQLGNRVSGMLVSLATTVADPVDRLVAVGEATKIAKAQQRITGDRLVADLAEVFSPAVVGRLARWTVSLKVFDRLPPICNVVVSSVPGPGSAIWCAGSRVVELYPVGPIMEGVGLNVTTMSYLGSVHFGLLGCRRLVPDIQDLGGMLDFSLRELVLTSAQGKSIAL